MTLADEPDQRGADWPDAVEPPPSSQPQDSAAADLASSPAASLAASLAANVTLAGWLAADMVRIALFAGKEFDIGWQALAEVGILGIAAVMVLLRPRPRRTDASPRTLAVVIAATLLPLLYAEAGMAAEASHGIIPVQACALALMGWATLSLGTNFSVLPHYRSLVTAGPYGLVRHPLYASYLLFDAALAIGMASVTAAALWLAEFALLLDRARREERLLAASDAGYRRYAVAVPWRLVPFLV
jgi:protein-S-isoprenylcysteine O-methyltransferase Ste14